MCQRLKTKVAIVTGAGRGIGRAVAVVFAREGARVVIAEIDPETARSAEQEIRAAGGEALAIVCDVTSEKQVKRMVDQAVKAFGPIDILINNAIGVPPPGPMEEGDDIWWDRCLAYRPAGDVVLL